VHGADQVKITIRWIADQSGRLIWDILVDEWQRVDRLLPYEGCALKRAMIDGERVIERSIVLVGEGAVEICGAVGGDGGLANNLIGRGLPG